MVEGHGVKRVCERHKRLLLNKLFKCDSPNGRFTEGAKRIDNKILYRIESIGKNLFYFFRGERNIKESSTVVHIHFGMSGRFYNSNLASLPKCTPTTRLRMVNKKANIGALLSAMTCVAGPLSLYEQKPQRVGGSASKLSPRQMRSLKVEQLEKTIQMELEALREEQELEDGQV